MELASKRKGGFWRIPVGSREVVRQRAALTLRYGALTGQERPIA